MATAEADRAYRVRMDSNRRPTVPAALLADAGIDGTHELVARADGQGRVVMGDPLVLLAAFQAAVAHGKRERAVAGDLVDDLFVDLAAGASALAATLP